MINKLWLIGILIVIGIVLTMCAQYYVQYSESERKSYGLKVRNWAIQLQGADPREIASSGFELVVIDYSRDGSEQGKYTPEEIQKMKNSGVIPIAYLSIGKAEDYRFYWKREWYTNPPKWLGREDPEWKGSYAVKYWSEEWKTILHTYLDKIIEQGFHGVFLDGVDEFEHWSDPNNGEDVYLSEDEAARRMIDLILDIANYCRSRVNGEFYIIPLNGERILKYDNGTLINIVSGWAAESLFYNGTKQWSSEDWNWIRENRLPYLDFVLSKGKPVFSIDYVDDGSGYFGANKERIDNYREKAISRGYIPYVAISDRELDELNIIKGVQP
ncbi:MJ1477/TM1410 family putative glycoside hydrolase [Staphylothermus hellenicus]|uniref:Cysteinyl-tRNA synthetase n=1 Tax=Staphylothermus hellenicus (strain DSM 12710 / JCM 10830 / BK20S6-10-b1 / P8) TaxID=591019 RepID=D7DB52_STAHD|nr:MJ1477/TM1410 family putative glycoside hydrolase [Staphylothermus hellenicus]ADI31399.1 cysteinyl-tRNA synthetase [Staphylothermus hellenicus DSM 12710]